MHPIERLRYVARSSGGDQRMLVRETATAIAGLDVDPAGLVVACRRIVERHATSGPLWWLCAKLVTSASPFRDAWGFADHIEEDPTANQLVELLGEGVTVCVVGWPDLAGEALIRRGDVTAQVIDSDDEGSALVHRLQRMDVDATEIPVWLVAGRGRRLPEPMWNAMLQRHAEVGRAWDLDVEPVPLAMVSAVAGPDGLVGADAAALAPECPMAHELLRISAM